MLAEPAVEHAAEPAEAQRQAAGVQAERTAELDGQKMEAEVLAHHAAERELRFEPKTRKGGINRMPNEQPLEPERRVERRSFVAIGRCKVFEDRWTERLAKKQIEEKTVEVTKVTRKRRQRGSSCARERRSGRRVSRQLICGTVG